MKNNDTFSEYVFVYRNSFGDWNVATNPVFIAEHKDCIAIKRDDIKEIRKYIPRYHKDGK